MKNKIKEFILKNITLKKISAGIAIAIIILIVMLLTVAVYSKKSSNDDYILNLINGVKEHNQKIPEFEQNLRILKLKKRCLNAQIERIKNNEDFEIDYCENVDNLEQFSELHKTISEEQQKQTSPVSFLVPSASADNSKKEEIAKNAIIQKTVQHKYWAVDDKKQKWLQYLYEKSGYDKDVVLTFLGENGTFEINRRSGKIGSNGYYDYGLCQLNYQRHKNFINSEDFKNPYKQLDYCLGVYEDGMKKGKIRTTFYAYNTRWKMEKNLEFN